MKTKICDVPTYTPEFVKLQQFARTFDHEIHPMRNGKVFCFEREGRVFGYADVLYVPIAFPAFHPALTTPRGVVEVLQSWRAHCQFQNAGDGLIGVPLAADRSTFPTEMIESAGFTRLKREIYSLSES